MTIRLLIPNDAKAIAVLWHAGATESGAVDRAFLPRLSQQDYTKVVREELESGAIFGWCALSADELSIVAYLTAELVKESVEWQMESYLYVIDVDVDSSARRQGHATRLLTKAAAHARALGLRRVELSWLANDKRATEVWSRLGFRSYLHRGFIDLREPADKRD